MTLGLSKRLTVTLVLVVVALQAVSMLAFLRLQQADQGEWRPPVPVRISAAANALDRTPRGRRDDLLVALNGDATRFFLSSGAPEGYQERPGPLPGLLGGYGAALEGRQVRLLAAHDRRAGWRRQTAGYALSVDLADGQKLIVAPGLTQRRRGVVLAALSVNFVTALAAALLVWRMVRRATQDFEAIAAASDRFADDLSAPPMDERADAEARRVASAFNRMRDRIRTLMADRMRMLAAVAHDLKTLLTRLRLRAALIEDDEQRARADRDIALMASLIEDVLMVSRGEEKPMNLVPVDVGAIVRDIVKERTALGQRVTTGRLDPGLAPAEPAAARRIIENLVENAVVYAGSAEVEFERNEDAWRLSVVDHGPGLPQACLEQALEPFWRGESSRSRETGGAGLGLSIVRSLAAQMQADLHLSQTAGGGLTVIIAKTI